MTRRVLWADTARAEYLGIIRYIADKNPDAAVRVAAQIETAAAKLGSLAIGRAGRVTGTYEKILPGLPYILAYEIEPIAEDVEAVVLLHIIHGARHWPEDEWPEP